LLGGVNLYSEKIEILSDEQKEKVLHHLDNSIVTGFQLASKSGPLCEEPMSGVCFILEDFILQSGPDFDNRGPFNGQVISAMKDACRNAFLSQSSRLFIAMFMC